MPSRKPLQSSLPPDAAAFVRGEEAPAAAPAPRTPEDEARVRFTVDLPRSIHKRLKLAAVERELPMTDLARQALVEWLDGQA
jgi:hypothetical protein